MKVLQPCLSSISERKPFSKGMTGEHSAVVCMLF
jgi:hypothetical protein